MRLQRNSAGRTAIPSANYERVTIVLLASVTQGLQLALLAPAGYTVRVPDLIAFCRPRPAPYVMLSRGSL